MGLEVCAAERRAGSLESLKGGGSRDALLTAVAQIVRPGDSGPALWQYGTLAGLLDALKRRGNTLNRLAAGGGERGVVILEGKKRLLREARKMALDPRAAAADRVVAVRLMAREPDGRVDDIRALGDLLVPRTAPRLQLAVVSHLGTLTDRAVAGTLLSGWRSHGPTVRVEILGVLSTRREWLLDLLDEIEGGQVTSADIDAGTRQSLMVYGDKKIRARVATLLSGSETTDRTAVLREYQPVLDLEGDSQRGEAVFKKLCSTCHKLEGVGQDVGPNLASITDRKSSSLLASIHDPAILLDKLTPRLLLHRLLIMLLPWYG